MNKVVISGYGVVPTASECNLDPLTPDLGVEASQLPRRLQRFANRATKAAATASACAFKQADIDPNHTNERFGLYTNQGGYQHPDLDDYEESLCHWQQDQGSALSHLWHSRDLSPFLAIKGLSNNTLGILSLLWSIRGDCAAFTLNHAGAAAALDEAIFNIQHDYIDRALVVSSGTVKDVFELRYQEHKEHRLSTELPAPEYGAVALLLENHHLAQKPLASITHFSQNYINGTTSAHTTNKPSWEDILKQHTYHHYQAPRWGGILYSTTQIVHRLQATPSDQTIAIHSQADQHHARIDIQSL